MRKSCSLQGIIHLGYFDIVFIQHTYINNIRQMSSLLHLGSTVKHFDVVLRIGLAFERGNCLSVLPHLFAVQNSTHPFIVSILPVLRARKNSFIVIFVTLQYTCQERSRDGSGMDTHLSQFVHAILLLHFKSVYMYL